MTSAWRNRKRKSERRTAQGLAAIIRKRRVIDQIHQLPQPHKHGPQQPLALPTTTSPLLLLLLLVVVVVLLLLLLLPSASRGWWCRCGRGDVCWGADDWGQLAGVASSDEVAA